MTYFFDTYALYEVARGAPNYASFEKPTDMRTTLFNLYELYFKLYQDGKSELAERFFEKLLPACLEVWPEDIKQAALWRLGQKRGVSYVDALGYIMATRRDLMFLTGDDAFKDMAGVELIK